MSTRRLLKAGEAIREAVSTAILLELDDPRIEHVTVTRVEVSPDMQLAKVYVSVMGTDEAEARSLKALQNAAGYLQQRVSEKIEMRYTPKLKFIIDKGVKNALAVSRILEEVLPRDESSSPAPQAASEPGAASRAPESMSNAGDDDSDPY